MPKPKVIPKPEYPTRGGVVAMETAKLAIVGMFCAFQYWLFTATVEAYHAGHHGMLLGAFLASLGCFAFAVGLVIASERALAKQQNFLRESRPAERQDKDRREGVAE